MNDPRRPRPRRTSHPAAGGAPIAITTIVGAIWGLSQGQATLGIVVGLGIGVAIALAIWAVSARRS